MTTGNNELKKFCLKALIRIRDIFTNRLLHEGGKRFKRLRDENDNWYTWGNGLEEHYQHYFSDIFRSSDPIVNDIVQYVNPKITNNHIHKLMMPFLGEEIRIAIFSTHLNKAPGPDGFNPGFFQFFWDIVGKDVIDFFLDCLNNQVLPDGLNDTNVVLIPKVKNPCTVK